MSTASKKKRNPPERTGRIVGLQIPFDLLKRLDAYRDLQQFQITNSMIIRLALQQFLDREEIKK